MGPTLTPDMLDAYPQMLSGSTRVCDVRVQPDLSVEPILLHWDR